MTNKISVIIIDANKDNNDYSKIIYDDGYYASEKNFDLTVLNSPKNIKEILNEKRTVDSIITIGDDFQYSLNYLSFEYRKKWVHFNTFEPVPIVNAIIATFKYNIGRVRDNSVKLFSFFTSTFNTDEYRLKRLYYSMVNQTYNNWNWFIIDDSTNDEVINIINSLKDSRITIIKNISNHGNIGFNKHMIAMMCDGDYIVEIDHDDELTLDCLEYLKNVFIDNNEIDFVYSDAIELTKNGEIIHYGDYFAFGQGVYKDDFVCGIKRNYPVCCPSINSKSIRGIYSMPNHVRAWKKEFYHKIGGHNIELSVLDDMEIIIRTFLNGKMAHINKVLYIQHMEGDRGDTENINNNTQSIRFKEIQRTNWLLYEKYDKKIHERILELNGTDEIWDDNLQHSVLNKKIKNLKFYDLQY